MTGFAKIILNGTFIKITFFIMLLTLMRPSLKLLCDHVMKDITDYWLYILHNKDKIAIDLCILWFQVVE